MFIVILQRPPESAAPDDEKSREKGREKGREKMLELIQQNPSITMKDLAEHLGRSPKSIEKQIRLLKAEGILTRQGPDRGGQWQVRQE
jgi:ATP-dependent DNA helicase RecG